MMRSLLGLAALVLMLCGMGQAEAGFIQVSSLAELRANDSLDWGQLGAAVSDPGNPVTVVSGNGSIMGVRVVVSQPGGSFQRRDEGYGWIGHFNLGDHLLFTNFGPGPITLVFSRPIHGIGFQSGSNAGGPFTTTLDVFNSSDNLLGTFSVTGLGGAAEDTGDAPFLGVLSSGVDIGKVVVSSTNNSGGFAINQLELVDPVVPPSVAVPEPSTLALLGIGSLALIGYGWRRRKEAATCAF